MIGDKAWMEWEALKAKYNLNTEELFEKLADLREKHNVTEALKDE